MALTWAHNGVRALVVLSAGFVIALILLVAKPEPQPEAPPPVKLPIVDVITAKPTDLSLAVETQGTVRPSREIKLVSQVAGRVESVSDRFAEGDFFAADEQLVKLEDIDYQFAIARAESQVAAAEQRFAEEGGRALQAKREWRDLGSKKANTLFLRKPQLASAEAELKASKADLAAAQLDLKRTSISAPFNGRISEKNVDLGQYVSLGDVIASVYDTDVAQVRLPLTGRQVALLDLPLNYDNTTIDRSGGAPVVLQARFANKLWAWQGRIVRTDASIDESSRLVYAVAEIAKPFAPEPGSDRPPLSPGLFVSASISGRQLSQVVLLPRSALRGDSSVMVVDAEHRTRLSEVQVLQSDASLVWVQGLEQGERVIVREPAQVGVGEEVAVNVLAEFTGQEY